MMTAISSKRFCRSLPAWGAWIEIGAEAYYMGNIIRSPHGERGLKSVRCLNTRRTLSLPAWGAWIEMENSLYSVWMEVRSPHGERGLKFYALHISI